jgi:hypothetical protein
MEKPWRRKRKKGGRKARGGGGGFNNSGVSWGGGGGGMSSGGGGGGMGFGRDGVSGGFSTSNEVSPENPLLGGGWQARAAPVAPPAPPAPTAEPYTQLVAARALPPPPPVFVPEPPRSATASASLITDLRLLTDLLVAGHLTPSEFAEAKSHVLRGASATTPDPARARARERNPSARAALMPLPPSFARGGSAASPFEDEFAYDDDEAAAFGSRGGGISRDARSSSMVTQPPASRRTSTQDAAFASHRRRSVANEVAGSGALSQFRYDKEAMHAFTDREKGRVFDARTQRVYDTHIRSAALDRTAAGSGARVTQSFDSRRASVGHDHWNGNVEVLSQSQAARATLGAPQRRASDYEGAQAGAGVLARFKYSTRTHTYVDPKTGEEYVPKFKVDAGTGQRYDAVTGEAR